MNTCLRVCPLVVALALAGCAGSALRLVPVHGRATVGKKAAQGLTIQLVPDAAKGTHAPAGGGQTDEDGRFVISTPPHGEGAVPGHYKVTVSSYTGRGVPRSYADPAKTPLRVEIPPGGLENWELDLPSP
jgi:hypothetical protein